MLTTYDQYKGQLSSVFGKYIRIFGKDITLAKLKQVEGITVAQDGTVTDLSKNLNDVLENIIKEFTDISEYVVRTTMKPILTDLLNQSSPTTSNQQTINQTVDRSQ